MSDESKKKIVEEERLRYKIECEKRSEIHFQILRTIKEGKFVDKSIFSYVKEGWVDPDGKLYPADGHSWWFTDRVMITEREIQRL